VRKFLIIVNGVALALAAMLAGPLLRIAFDPNVKLGGDWRSASAAPMGWAPAPDEHEPAIVQAYAAPAFNWRGAFSDHCWIAVKPAGASQYLRYEVVGFNVSRNRPAIRETYTATPNQEWYGARPKLLRDIRGAEAEKIIAALPAAIAAYPHPRTYQVWPGPNSNTFIAHLAREIPQLRLALPGNALGKDYMGWTVFARAPSGTGFQISLGGIFGLLIAWHEGFELNVLGLVIGINPMHGAVTIPGIGRLPSRSDWTDEKPDAAMQVPPKNA
jgi:hypothetical protein